MSRFLVWLYRHGITGAIIKDLIRKYELAKGGSDDEEECLETVRGHWLVINALPIMLEKDGIDKKVRLDIKKEQWDEMPPNSLYDLFLDILYIETEIGPDDPQTYNICGRAFVDEALKKGMDFTQEYQSKARLLVRLKRLSDKDLGHWEQGLTHKLKPLLKNWIIPAIILGLLLGAWATRWEVTASRTRDDFVLKWKTDRWTGDQWLVAHHIKGVVEYPLKGSEHSKTSATNVAMGIGYASLAWLICAIYLTQKEAKHK